MANNIDLDQILHSAASDLDYAVCSGLSVKILKDGICNKDFFSYYITLTYILSMFSSPVLKYRKRYCTTLVPALVSVLGASALTKILKF